jgi:uncharacterized protein with HEPN domain
MKDSRAVALIQDMLTSIAKIEGYTAGMELAAFLASDLVKDAVARNLEIIGEAATKLQSVAPDVTRRRPDIPWHLARGMRNVIAHDYAGVNYERVWRTIREELPALTKQLEALAVSITTD